MVVILWKSGTEVAETYSEMTVLSDVDYLWVLVGYNFTLLL